MRICARSGCSSPAAAVLTYDRTTQTAYLSSVDDPSIRTPGDLCERHLNRFVLPRAWTLVDRRDDGALRSEPLRAVPVATPRVAATRRPATRKWVEAGPSLFDSTASDAAAASAIPGVVEAEPAEPVWMPRFGSDAELEGVLDAKTPLLRRAFGGR
jgi:hypothetical protein